jgi:hypothetical protein
VKNRGRFTGLVGKECVGVRIGEGSVSETLKCLIKLSWLIRDGVC